MAAAGLGADELQLNWQQQVDEVLALEAIYGSNFRILEASGVLEDQLSSTQHPSSSGKGGAGPSNSSGGTPAAVLPPSLDAAALASLDAPGSGIWALHCSLMVEVEPPGGTLRLLLPAQQQAQNAERGGQSGSGDLCNGKGGSGSSPNRSSSLDAASQGNGSAPESSAGIEADGNSGGGGGGGGYAVQHLPPICMQLRLGEGYPSEHAPRVSLSALWLSATAAARLEQRLLELWEEQGPGAPVCYTWADWLQSSALECLGASQALLLADEEPSGRNIASSSGAGSLCDADEERARGCGRAGSCSRAGSTAGNLRTGEDDCQQQAQADSQPGLIGSSRRTNGRCRGGGNSRASSGREGSSVNGGSDGGSTSTSTCTSTSEGAAGLEGSAEDRLVKLLRYDAVQQHAAFQRSLHTCGICLEQQLGRQFVRLEGCRHAWCASCLGEQARIHVAEGGLEKLKCPDRSCGVPLGPHVLQRLLCHQDFARWEQLTLQRTLDTMPDAAYCPRCSTVSIEDSDSCAQCPKCLFVFCSLCNEGWHPGTTCVSAETKLAMLRRKMEGGSRAAVEDLRRQEQELLSLAQIEKTAKKCPRCGTATQKAEGCNKITCGGCGAYWCWRCGKEIDGYRHFRSGECILFDEAEILRWEAQWEEMQAAARVYAAGVRNEWVGETAARGGGRPRGCFCPQCGQINHKMGNNNHMQCWSCTSHFCYCCRAVLRGRGAGGSHFGPRGCRQHTPD